MGTSFYLTKSDFNVLTSTDDITANSKNATQAIMEGVTDNISLIKSIEAYNTTNNLSLNKRVKYSIGLKSGVYIPVLYSYFTNNENTLVIVSNEQSGHTSLEYEQDSKEYPKMISAKSAVSTHVVPVENIIDVMFGNYDPSEVDIFEKTGGDSTNTMSEKELVNKLSVLLSDINALHSAGMYKDLIKKINYEFKKHAYDTLDYNYNTNAYSIYIQIADKYLSIINEIYYNYENVETRLNEDTRSRFIFVDDMSMEEVIEALEEKNDRRASNSLLEQFVFNYSDLTLLAYVLDKPFVQYTPDIV